MFNEGYLTVLYYTQAIKKKKVRGLREAAELEV